MTNQAANGILDPDELASRIAAHIALPENLAGMVEEAVDRAIRDKGLDKVARKSGLWGGEEASPEVTRKQLADAFVTACVFKACGIEPGGIYQKALSEGTATAGGYLTPEGFRAELVKRAAELSELYPYVRKIPVNADSGSGPSLSTDVSITWGTAENAALTETDPAFGQVTWNISKMSALTYISRELVSDSNPGIIQVVTELFQEAVAAERDKRIAVGTGSSQPTGIVSATGISAVSGCSGTLTYAKLVTLKYGLARKYHKRARWIMSGTTLGWISKLVDNNGQPLIRDPLVSGEPPLILGLPYSTQDDIDDGLVFVGDLGYYFWFDREQLVIETTTTGGDTFAKHQVGIKAVERCDGKVGLAEAFKKSGAFTAPS